ncbi:MAG: adenosylcobinamide-GDP ribazoletransferase [Sulfitobacter sp.]
MTGNDMPPFRLKFSDLGLALALLTRLPLPALSFDETATRPAAYAAWAYPLVGFAVGGVAALCGLLALTLGLPPLAVALIAVFGGIVASGAMHEDGLADCADGFWGGWERERRLEIMKDSQIGTYGVIALIGAIGLRWVALSALFSASFGVVTLLSAAVVSRAAMVGVMHALPPARAGGLSRKTGKPPRAAALIALGIGLGALLFAPAPFAVLILVISAAGLGTALLARTKIGGQTGDVLGATQQIVELAILLTCLANIS